MATIHNEIPRNEKENYFRMRLLLERASNVVQDILSAELQAKYTGHFDPSNGGVLFDVLDNHQVKHSLINLKRQRVMNVSQMRLLYPSGNSSKVVKIQDLDLTLTVLLLRNITRLNPKARWDNPPVSDASTEANIGRVKNYRNEHMHGNPRLTDISFQSKFNELKNILLSLSPLYNDDDYKKLLIEPLNATVAPCELLSVKLPRQLAGLEGREDLIQDILQKIASETPLVLLTGMGGIGKTSVAIAVGHRMQMVLYIDMREVTNLESIRLSLVQHYHPNKFLKDLYADYQNIFKQTLSSLTSETVLILDNIDQVLASCLQEFQHLLRDVMNSTKHITLLCTSRESFAVLSQNIDVVKVAPLDKKSSIDVLMGGNAANRSVTESEVLGEIAANCGNSPLALQLVAAQLRSKSAQRVLNRMKTKNVIETLTVPNIPAPQQMMTCLNMSYETLNPQEQKVFRALYIFPVSFSFDVVSSISNVPDDQCEIVLDSLVNKSLLSTDSDNYDLHPLLRAYAEHHAMEDQNEMSSTQDAYCSYYLKLVSSLAAEFEFHLYKNTYEKATKGVPHLRVTVDLLLCQLNNHNVANPEVISGLMWIGVTFNYLFLYDEALTVFQRLEDAAKNGLFDIQQYGITIYHFTAAAHGVLGKYSEALTYHWKCFAIREDVLGAKHPDIANSYERIGNILHIMGKHTEAIKYHKKCLEIREDVFGPRHPDTAVSYNNIGSLLHAMGEYTEALRYLMRS